MTDRSNQTSGRPLVDQALDWVLLLRSGRATAADADALRTWREQSPEHEEAFKTAVRLWRDLGMVARGLQTSGQLSLLASVAQTTSQLLSRRALLGGAVAVSAAAASYAVFYPPLGLWPSLAELTADYRTRKGEQRDVTLGDNIKLRLNTQTSVAVRSMQQGPEIELIAGEAVITAERSEESPLVVIAADGRLIATKAHFDARCTDNTVLVTCAEGLLTVEQGGRSIVLHQGEQASYSTASALGEPVRVDAQQITSWQEGLLIFHDRPLTEVIAEVNRYRHGQIILMNGQLGQRMVNGSFRLDQLDNVVGQIRQLFDAHVQNLPGGIVLVS
jgi:transmembrane sensor